MSRSKIKLPKNWKKLNTRRHELINRDVYKKDLTVDEKEELRKLQIYGNLISLQTMPSSFDLIFQMEKQVAEIILKKIEISQEDKYWLEKTFPQGVPEHLLPYSVKKVFEWISWSPTVTEDILLNLISFYEQKGYFTDIQKSKIKNYIEDLYQCNSPDIPEDINFQFRFIYENKLEQFLGFLD